MDFAKTEADDRATTFDVSPSPLKAFWREGRRLPGYSLFDFLHAYVYARWTYLYIGLGTGEHSLTRRVRRIGAWLSWAMPRRGQPDPMGHARGYHGKVVPLDEARELVQVREDITLRDLEHVVPYPVARDIVLHHPDHIVVLDCPCRSSRAEPCLPLDVCLIVGEPFASLVLSTHPDKARAITSMQADEILSQEHARGHVHHAFFKDAMLGRFYAICNCCGCCCGAMQSMRNGTPMLASSGYVSEPDPELCIGCGECADACSFGALGVMDGAAIVDGAKCMGCGVCIQACEMGALRLVRDAGKPAPLVLRELLEAAEA